VIRAQMLVAALALAATPGCSYVTANQNATQTVSGELWYVKQRAFFGLVFSSRIFHCAPPGLGSAKCKEASIAAGASLTDLATATVVDTGTAANKTADDASTQTKDATTDKDKKAKDKDKKK
jgi:hypothetical protein